MTQKFKRIHDNTALAVTGVIKGTSEGNLYNKLGMNIWNLCVGLVSYARFITIKQVVYRIIVWSYSTNQLFIQYLCFGRCYRNLQ